MPSQVLTYQSNLNQVSGALASTRIAVTSAISVLDVTQDALEALKKIDTDADALAKVADGLELALKLVSKLGGPVGSITKGLKTAIKKVEARAEDVKEAAGKADSKFSPYLNLVKFEKALLEGELLVIDQSIREIASIEAGLADAVDVVENTYEMDDLDLFSGAIAGANNTVAGINAGYVDIVTIINNIDSAKAAVSTALAGVKAPAQLIVNAMNSISTVLSKVNFLSGPLGVLQDVLAPVEWALDAIDFIYNNTVGLVVNPIIDALGIADLFQGILDSVGLGNLPSLNIFGDFDTPFDGLVTALNADVIDPLAAAIQDLADEVIGTDLLGAVNGDPNNNANLVIGDDDNPPPEDAGTELNAMDGDDLVAGGLGDDTLNGGLGDDLLIGGRGDDIIDGGDGYDGAVFFGEFRDFRFSYATNGALTVSQRDGTGGNQGTDRLLNIEKVIFTDQSFDIEDFEDFFTAQSDDGETVTGNENDNYVFGGDGDDELYGLAGDDYISGGAGYDELYGGDGDDTLDGGDVGEDYFGGAGNDTVTYATYGWGGRNDREVTASLLNDPSRTPFGTSENFDSIENITNGGDARSWFWGDNTDNTLKGGTSLDRINGFGGDDIIFGGQGKDQLVGGAGNDYVDGGEGENLFIGGTGNDTYVHRGNNDHELWYGGVRAFEWSDQAYNWRSVENTEIIENYDFVRLRVMGFLEQDVATLLPASVTINMGTSTVQKFNSAGVSVGEDTFTGIDTVTGSEGDDTLIGALIPTYLYGGGGNDRFIGADRDLDGNFSSMDGDAGNDLFYPGKGVTLVTGGLGNDTLFINNDGFVNFEADDGPNGGQGFDTINFSGSLRAWENVDGQYNDFFDFLGFKPGDSRDPVTGEYIDVDTKSTRGIEQIVGSKFDDILQTGHDVIRLRGGDGNDRLTLTNPFGVFSHSAYGDAGDDTLFGGAGLETLYGGEGNDQIWTLSLDLANTSAQGGYYYGDAGNDTIYVTEKNPASGTFSFFFGGDGFDTVDYTYQDAGVVASLTDGDLTGIEQLRGTRFGDSFLGDDLTNVLIGMGGNDTLRGLGGNDTIYTGSGNDIADGGAGNDRIFAAQGFNTVSGGTGTDTLSFDAYQTAEERQSTPGWTPEETLGSADVDMQAGRAFFGTDNENESGLDETTFTSIENITGTWADDILRGDGGNNVILGGLRDGADFIEGRHGDDILSGGDGNDELYGDFEQPQRDVGDIAAMSFNKGAAADQAAVLDGYNLPSDAVTVELLFRANAAVTPSSYQTFFSYAAGNPVDHEEFLIFGYTELFNGSLGLRINGTNVISNVATTTLFDGEIHRLSATYDAGAVALYVDGELIVSGNTSASGLAQNGRIVIAQDQDADGLFRDRKTMHGEVADIRVWDVARDATEIQDTAFSSALDPDDNPDLLTNWQANPDDPTVLVDTIGDADMTVVGDGEIVSFADGNDTIDGGNGKDRLFGAAGDDTLYGGKGRDTVFGQAGDDTLYGDVGHDKLVGGMGHDHIEGGTGNDTIRGGSGADYLFGDEGTDTLSGDRGNDTLIGGAENDILSGGIGNDSLDGGDGNDVLRGGMNFDILFGGNGNDRLFGNLGYDVLNGGAGNDVLFGGTDGQRDVFVFASTENGGGGRDRIKDFEDGVDRIDLNLSGETDFASVLAKTVQDGSDLVITLSQTDILIIENTLLADFDASDVDF